MKKNLIKVSEVRKEFKQNAGTINECLTIIYAVMQQQKEDEKTCKLLRKVMPSSKNKAKEYRQAIKEAYNIGAWEDVYKLNKVTGEKERQPKMRQIKCTPNKIITFFVQLHNETLPEDAI